MLGVAKLAGWPTLPRIQGPPALRRKIGAERLASDLYHLLCGIASQPNFRDTAKQTVINLLNRRDPIEVIDASLLAARLFSADRIGKALEILSGEKVMKLAADIENKARVLADQLLVGKVNHNDVSHLCAAGAISNELMYLFHEEEMLGVLSYFKIGELDNPELAYRLRDNPAERERFVAERENYQPGPGAQKASEDFFAHLTQLSAALEELKGEELFWSPYFAIRENLMNEELKKTLYQKDLPIAEVEKFLTHDIGHTFAMTLIDRLALKTERPDYRLAYFLHGFCHLTSHLKHLTYVLSVNKYRLDGELPQHQEASLSEIVKTAVRATRHRWKMPVNVEGEPREGHINCFIYKDMKVNIIPEMLELILYNLCKNSIKAVIEADMEQSKFSITINVKSDSQYPGVMVISVEDNAAGFDFNRLIKAAKVIVEDPRNAEVVASMPVFVKLLRWQGAPFTLRTWALGEVFDLAFVSNLSGFSDQSISSGIGLAEAAEFAQLLGMKILLTNTYRGGALVNLIIGKEEEVNAVIARELGYKQA